MRWDQILLSTTLIGSLIRLNSFLIKQPCARPEAKPRKKEAPMRLKKTVTTTVKKMMKKTWITMSSF